ncbi:MAG: transposase, partial [Pseudomonadota bacterium]|nr:transposase [Pseudomonadota bacterium]
MYGITVATSNVAEEYSTTAPLLLYFPAEYDRAIAQAAREDARSKRLMQLPGIGPTTASALLASLGGAHEFDNGRQVAAWIGLVPGQYSSGGKARLGRITKAGDRYLRSLLVMGARAILSG